MGSKRDFKFASRIQRYLQDEKFDITCEYLVASAHKTPRRLLEVVEEYNGTSGQFVFITVAGLSDALSGVVAGSTKNPVIACPPDSEKYGWAKCFSSTITPQGVAVTFAPRPENAALAALKILALSDKKLQDSISSYLKKLKASVIDSSMEFIDERNDER
jgi:5-(carboxyamino)imidazole ribonucleotide mutase